MRDLTNDEREVLRAVVRTGVPEDEYLRVALLAQLDVAHVSGTSCDCGCASVALSVDTSSAPPARLREFSAGAVRGSETWNFRVLLRDGYLVDVEFYGHGDVDDTSWPPAESIR